MISRRHLLIAPAVAPIFYMGRAFSCDDPPEHYKSPCKTGYSSSSAYIPIVVAQGMFEKNKVHTTPFLIQAVENILGDKDLGVASLSGTEMLEGLRKGAKFTVIATPVTDIDISLWTTGSVKNLKDLRQGATIGVGLFGSGQALAFEALAKESGVPVNQFKYAVKNQDVRIQDLRSNNLEAALFSSESDNILKNLGFARIQQKTISIASDVLVVNTESLKDVRNIPFFVGVLKSVRESIEFLQRQENKSKCLEAIELHGKVGKSLAERIYLASLRAKPRFGSSVESVRGLFDDVRVGSPAASAELKDIRPENIVTQAVVTQLR